MINEAIETLFQGVGTVETIDEMMKLGMGHPMGPLRLADFIGLDVCLSVLEVLHQGFGKDKYAPCPLLRNMVASGNLGVKTKRGFTTTVKTLSSLFHSLFNCFFCVQLPLYSTFSLTLLFYSLVPLVFLDVGFLYPRNNHFLAKFLAIPFLALFLLLTKQPLNFTKRWSFPLVVAGVFLGTHWVTYFYALQWSNVAIGMLSLFTFPVITACLEPLFLKTKFKWRHLFLEWTYTDWNLLLSTLLCFG